MEEELSHILRRTTMTAHPERAKRLAGKSAADVVGHILNEVELNDEGVAELPWSGADGPSNVDDDWGSTAVWWVYRMASAEAGLVDRMAWTWHNWFTTSDEAYQGHRLTADQLEILYRYGLSDIPTLLQKMATSGAMLRYLDAAGSEAYNPNENLARELMELYTIGPGNYDEHDVRGAARALAGWDVDDETGEISFDPSAAFVAPLVLFGVQDEWDTDKLIGALAAHRGTAERMAGHLWAELVGVPATPNEIADLADTFADNELRILPVVERILKSDAFAGASRNRYSSAIEWLVAAMAATDPRQDRDDWIEAWNLNGLGQRPFYPPSPAGWPAGHYWARPGSLLPRLHFARDIEPVSMSGRPWTAESILDAAGLPAGDPSAPHIASILADDRFDDETGPYIAWRVAVTCPTFQLA